MAIDKDKTRLYQMLLWFIILLCLIIIVLNTVSFATGVSITFKVYFIFLLGILYGVLSIRCFYVYPKHLYYEQHKARFSEQPETHNTEAAKRERQRIDEFLAHAKYSTEYNQLSQLLYLLQGVTALALGVEFLGEYLICKVF